MISVVSRWWLNYTVLSGCGTGLFTGLAINTVNAFRVVENLGNSDYFAAVCHHDFHLAARYSFTAIAL